MVVEDSALVAGALRLLLEETGHRVSTAGSVAEAIAAAVRERPDVMLLDLTLPDGDGLEVLSALARAGRSPVVSVAVTGHHADDVRDRCVAAGCTDILVKPIAAMALPGQIREWLAAADGLTER